MRYAARTTTFLAAAALLWPVTSEAQEAGEVARGARVYSSTCGRCHNPRPATERTDAEWVTIVAQMRARATMSRSDARAVLAFLRATNLPERSPVAGAAGAASTTGVTVVVAPPPPVPPPAPPATRWWDSALDRSIALEDENPDRVVVESERAEEPEQ